MLLMTAATFAAGDAPNVDVTEKAGIYRVAATFRVPHAPAAAVAVLTDFERIPTYLPDIKSSTVLERSAGGTLVEQEAVARFLMFSKRVHLVLRVNEAAGVIRFRDECGQSFEIYDGSWTVRPSGAGSTITYQLDAKPNFDVPAFVLRRLLKRDATDLIGRISNEIRVRDRQ
jgi:carbon monoxide dehydrogenase subunit G